MKNDACLDNYHSCSSLPPSSLAKVGAKRDWKVKDRDWINTSTFQESNTLKLPRSRRRGHTALMEKNNQRFFGGVFWSWWIFAFLSVTHIRDESPKHRYSDSKHTPRERRKDEFFCHTTFEAYLFHLEANCFQMRYAAKPNCKHPLIFFPALLQKHPVLIFFFFSSPHRRRNPRLEQIFVFHLDLLKTAAPKKKVVSHDLPNRNQVQSQNWWDYMGQPNNRKKHYGLLGFFCCC